MENFVSSERDPDLESGQITSEEDTSKDLVSGGTRLKNVVSRVLSRFLGPSGSTGGARVVNSLTSSENFSEVVDENVELLVDKSSGGEESEEHLSLVDKKHVKEKRKKSNFKKAPKPPRPPKGPLMDAADMKLVKEMSEIAMKKRARIEHMKALKKMKAAKSSSASSNSSLAAMIITVLFFLVILFQGICSRSSSSVSFHGSPEPSKATDGLISVQIYKDFSNSGPNSASPNSGVEQVSGSESTNEDKLG